MMSNQLCAKNQLKKIRTPVLRAGVRICRLVAASNDPVRSSRFLVLLVVVDFSELGVDDIVLLGFGTAAAIATTAAGLLLGLLVHRLAELHRRLRQRVGLRGDRLRVATLQ